MSVSQGCLGRGVAGSELLSGVVAAVSTQSVSVAFALGLTKGSGHLHPEDPTTLVMSGPGAK